MRERKVMAGKFITPAGDFNYSLKTTRQEPEPLLPAIIIHHAASPIPQPCPTVPHSPALSYCAPFPPTSLHGSIILSTVWKTFFFSSIFLCLIKRTLHLFGCLWWKKGFSFCVKVKINIYIVFFLSTKMNEERRSFFAVLFKISYLLSSVW